MPRAPPQKLVYGKVANILASYSGVLRAVRGTSKILRLCRRNHSESTDSELNLRLPPNIPLALKYIKYHPKSTSKIDLRYIKIYL